VRHLKPDVSHRMRKRPSIFTARWFRVLLGAGAVVVAALWLGPPVAGWLRGETTRQSATPSRPAPVPAARATDPAVAIAAPRSDPGPAVRTPPVSESRPVPPAASVKASPEAPSGQPPEPPRRVAGAASAVPAPPAEAAAVRRPASELFRIQVGAFRDPQNAERLAERLRGEGAEVLVAGSGDEPGSLYRVIARPPDGEAVNGFVQRLRELGHRAEETPEGVAVGQAVPLRAAIETTRQLREQGMRVRLERTSVPGGGLRAVRVGAYATLEEAERARTELAERGYPAIVVRDR
jgi:cell division septation protein DedD